MKNSSAEQDHHLYNLKWTEALDSYLIRRLMEREKECHPISPVDSSHALVCAMEALNKELDADLTYVEVRERVEFLRRRYTCFKKLLNRIETDWDVVNNRISADERVWKAIFQADSLAKAYHTKGDPQWYQLCRVFGWKNIKQEASPTIIVISESPDALYSCASASEDEVTSPLLKPTTARKLLFEDDAHFSVGPLSHTPPNLLNAWAVEEDKIGFPPPNAFPRNTRDYNGNEKHIQHSSCMSWNPQE